MPIKPNIVAFQAVRKVYEFAREPEQLFCMVVSLTHPHPPFLTTPAYWEQVDDVDIPPPRTGRLPTENLDPHSERCRRVIGLLEDDVDAATSRSARRAYCGMVSYFYDKLA